MTPSILTLTMILSETCATTVSGLESSSFVLAFNDTTNEKYLQANINITLIIIMLQPILATYTMYNIHTAMWLVTDYSYFWSGFGLPLFLGLFAVVSLYACIKFELLALVSIIS